MGHLPFPLPRRPNPLDEPAAPYGSHSTMVVRTLRERREYPQDLAGWVAWLVFLPLWWLPWRVRDRQARRDKVWRRLP